MAPKGCSSSTGSRVLATIWSLAAMAVMVVALRLYSQWRVVRYFRSPDIFISLSLITALCSTSLNTYAIANALGDHMSCLNTPGKLNAMQWEYAGLVPGSLAAPLARISFCLYMLPFGGFCQKWKTGFWTIIISQAVVSIGFTVGLIVTCALSSEHWDLEHASICWASSTMTRVSIAQGGFNAATDLILTILPFLILRKLQMARSTKIVLSILLGMSILTMAACILKVIELYHLSESKDLTYDTARFIVWLALERYIAIIAVSVPTIRPLAVFVLRDRLKWFRTPPNHGDQYPDRTWISRNPTRFTFETELHSINSPRSTSLPCPPPGLRDEDLDRLATCLNRPGVPVTRRGAAIRKTTTVETSSVEREEGYGFDRAYIEVSGLSRSAVEGGEGASMDGIWEN